MKKKIKKQKNIGGRGSFATTDQNKNKLVLSSYHPVSGLVI